MDEFMCKKVSTKRSGIGWLLHTGMFQNHSTYYYGHIKTFHDWIPRRTKNYSIVHTEITIFHVEEGILDFFYAHHIFLQIFRLKQAYTKRWKETEGILWYHPQRSSNDACTETQSCRMNHNWVGRSFFRWYSFLIHEW